MDTIKCWNCQCHHPSRWERGKYWCTEHQRVVAPDDGCSFGKKQIKYGYNAFFNEANEYIPKDIVYKLIIKGEQIMDLTNSDFCLNFIKLEPHDAKNIDEAERIVLILERDRYDKKHLYR